MLTLPEQVGQLLIVGLDGSGWDRELETFLRGIRPGGVIFFQRNIQSAPDFRRLVESVRQTLESPLLALDLEGGLVDRLRDVLAPLPAVRDVARAGLGKTMGRIAGRELAAFSLNVDFAPVLDLGVLESRKILGSRTAGDSPDEVIRFARSFLEGLAESGVIGCGKHFPGLGSGQKDSHKELPSVEKDEREMWQVDLQPFRALASTLPIIMVAHVYCPGLERAFAPERDQASRPIPATLSSAIVSGLLKGRMGFHGLVLSDDLEMGGVLEGRSMEEAATAALKAGCDMLLLCGPAANTRKIFEALLRKANADPGFRSVVEQAAQKVTVVKNKFGIMRRQGIGNREQGTVQLPDFDALRREINDFSAAVQQRLESNTLREES